MLPRPLTVMKITLMKESGSSEHYKRDVKTHLGMILFIIIHCDCGDGSVDVFIHEDILHCAL